MDIGWRRVKQHLHIPREEGSAYIRLGVLVGWLDPSLGSMVMLGYMQCGFQCWVTV